jgi:uncharacterized membrane protein
MEKSYQLDQKEMNQLQPLDQERTNALAMIGALSLDMEQARKNLETASERQRAFIRQALSARGVERYDNARLQNGALSVTLPDNPTAPAENVKMMERPNGPIVDAKETT